MPVLRAPYFEAEVLGAAMLDRLGERAVRRAPTPAALLHAGLAREFGLEDGAGTCGSRCRSPSKGDVSLKKVGDELVVRVDGRKRTVVLPPRWRR